MKVSLLRGTTGSNLPTLNTFRSGVRAYSFDQTTMNELFFDLQLPHGWTPGTQLDPHIHWSPGNSTNTGSVRWGLEYSWASVGEPFPASTTLYATQAAAGVAYQHQLVSFGMLASDGKAVSSVLACRLFRDATNAGDTFTAGAFGISLDFHYQVRSFGTVMEF
jgi:hypothetical protein